MLYYTPKKYIYYHCIHNDPIYKIINLFNLHSKHKKARISLFYSSCLPKNRSKKSYLPQKVNSARKKISPQTTLSKKKQKNYDSDTKPYLKKNINLMCKCKA